MIRNIIAELFITSSRIHMMYNYSLCSHSRETLRLYHFHTRFPLPCKHSILTASISLRGTLLNYESFSDNIIWSIVVEPVSYNWWPWPGLNRYVIFQTRDFKSLVSAYSTTRPLYRSLGCGLSSHWRPQDCYHHVSLHTLLTHYITIAPRYLVPWRVSRN